LGCRCDSWFRPNPAEVTSTAFGKKEGRPEAACGRLIVGPARFREHAHDVAFLHDQKVLALDLDFGARPLAEQYAVADLEVDRDQLARLIASAGTDGRDFALRGLFLGAVGNDDATLGFFFGIDTLDDNTVMQRTKFGFSHDGSFEDLVLGLDLPLKADWKYGTYSDHPKAPDCPHSP
jgi:hypothetical protein